MYIVVEGPIGVGKTSLAKRLAGYSFASGQTAEGTNGQPVQAQLNLAQLNLEVVEENPFLARFYQQPESYSFQVQVFFLLSRFKQLSGIAQPGLFSGDVVSDYLFDKDFIFAAMNLKDAEFALYEDLYAHLSPRLPTPDLVVYLRAETPELLRRIAKRGRPFEHDMQADYLSNLSTRYDEYFRTYPHPLLTIDAARYDFIERPGDEQAIVQQVREALAAGHSLGQELP